MAPVSIKAKSGDGGKMLAYTVTDVPAAPAALKSLGGSAFRGTRLYFNPKDIYQAGFPLGGVVGVQVYGAEKESSEGEEALLLGWMHPEIKRGYVAIPALHRQILGVSIGSRVTVGSATHVTVLHLSEINIRPRVSVAVAKALSHLTSPATSAFISAYLSSQIVDPKNGVEICVSGETYVFDVVSAVDDVGSEVELGVGALTQEMTKVSVSGSQERNTKTVIRVNNATKVEVSLPTGSVPSDVELSTSSSISEVTSQGSEGRVRKEGEEKKELPVVGGLKEELSQLREAARLCLRDSDVLAKYGLKAPRGILLHGPPGTGKTLLARRLAQEMGCSLQVVNGPEVMSPYIGVAERRLRDIFSAAAESSPAIVFLDEVDTLAPRREDSAGGGVAQRVVATLLTILDGLGSSASHAGVFVIAATNRADALDPALRRPGRFDREVEIGVPKESARVSIITALLKKIPNALTKEEIGQVAGAANGYVGADLAALVREAGLSAFRRRNISTSSGSGAVLPSVVLSDFQAALRTVRPSVMRESSLNVGNTTFEDVGGLGDVIHRLRQAVEWPLQRAKDFARLGVVPPKGILLYGPPGCSKTLLARACASTSGMNFLAVKGPELFDKYVGESEKAMRKLFARARAAAPCVVFFDEIDAIGGRRGADSSGGSGAVQERLLNQLLNELDGVEPLHSVVVLGTTNRPDILDPALLRPGRLDRHMYVGLPETEARREIFEIHTRATPCAGDVDLQDFAERTKGYTGAEIAAVCREAALSALTSREDAQFVMKSDLDSALESVHAQTSPQDLKLFFDFLNKGSMGKTAL